MEGLAKAKEEGIVKAVGISCHNWDAMAEAAQNPWCDIILAALNHSKAIWTVLRKM